MLVPIDDNILKEYNLRPDEYYWLFCLYTKALPKADIMIEPEILVSKGYVDNTENPKLTEEGKEIFGESKLEEKVKEFWEKFPAQVLTSDKKIRILRPKDFDSHVGRQVTKMYRPLLKYHTQIMYGLNQQLAAGSLEYFNNIETWLRQHKWESYLKINHEMSVGTSESSSGEKIL